MRLPEPARRRRAGGFTLVEVLVAFTVLVILLGVVVQAFGGGLRNARLGAAYSRAVLLAQSRLSALDPLEGPGEQSGESPDGMRWSASLSTFAPPGGEDADPWPVTAYEAVVIVTWDDGGERREVSLRSLRLGESR